MHVAEYVPAGDYTKAMLDREAKQAARAHSDANGSGRPLGVEWTVAPTKCGMTLRVSYHCNRPTGECGIYRVNVAL